MSWCYRCTDPWDQREWRISHFPQISLKSLSLKSLRPTKAVDNCTSV